MIEVSGLTKNYGPIAAVENVSFEVAQGEIIGFLGPNGAGKTTTMRILTGFCPASRGVARVAGYDVHERSLEVKRRVGYLPETVPLYPEMVVSVFLRYVAAVKGVPRAKRRAEVGRVIERCGLSSVEGRVQRNLSKGFRQRVGLAQALIGSPPVLILDEPTVGLDPSQIVEIRSMIRELAEDHTVLLSTHILPEVTMVCERVLIIHQGRLVAQDTMANLAGKGRPGVFEAEVKGTAATVVPVLESVAEVERVSEAAPGRYRLECAPEVELGTPVARAVLEAGLELTGIERLTRTLEDVFMEVIASDRGDAA
ncbi:MAG TPA: ATP-binding cassette domain-containing protein [Candidatus Hydrogenedentes bacterium]|nr:ATP-binding cassette domain-containing protein [Candidatus Hydrogenedentota bacterium]